MSNFCPNCGNEVTEGSDICLKCGKILNRPNENIQDAKIPYSGMAIAGFVVSLCSIILSFWGITPVISIILSVLGLLKAKNDGYKGRGLAIAGLVIGIISLVLTICGLAVIWGMQPAI